MHTASAARAHSPACTASEVVPASDAAFPAAAALDDGVRDRNAQLALRLGAAHRTRVAAPREPRAELGEARARPSASRGP